MKLCRLLALPICFALLASAGPPRSITVSLRPVASGGSINAVQVRETLDGYEGEAGKPLLMVPARIALTRGQAYRDGDVVAHDEAGPLPLAMVLVPTDPGAPIAPRMFVPQRATKGSITLDYRALVTAALSPRPRGPSYDLRGIDGGFGGAFFSFLLLPVDTERQADLRVHWDFAALPAGALGASTSGPGDLSLAGSPQMLWPIFILGGKVRSFAPLGNGFRAYWIGTPPFDAPAMASWTARSFAMLQGFFRDRESRPFTLLMRPFPLPRDGGGAARGGFMLEYGVGRLSDESRRIMFTHEMVHHFVGSLDGDSSANAWYGEGLAEFFKSRLTYRAGLVPFAAVARELAVMTDAYYRSELVTTPYDEVGRARWAGGAAQSVPYNRGFIYFVDVNAKVVRQSGGKRSLDDLVLAMLDRRRAGKSYDLAAWREIVRGELGESGDADLDAMLAGKLIVPAENAFGRCFRRVRADDRRRELGFDENAVLVAPHIVSDLRSGSAADKAGLRDGDRIVSSTGVTERIAHSASNVVLAPEVGLTVERDGVRRKIAFSTEGTSFTAYRWIPTRATASCELP